jgi:hypothetical protein
MIRLINVTGSLLAVSFLVPAATRGQVPQEPGQNLTVRLAASPVQAEASRPMIRSGLRTDAQITFTPTQETMAPNLKSEDTALWLSLGSTLLPLAAGGVMIAASDAEGSLSTAGALLVSSGLYFGPAVGYWYGGASGRGWKGVGIRLGTGIAAGLAITLICGDNNCNGSVFDDDDVRSATAASLVALAATGVILGSAIYDLARVKSHVRKANEQKLRDSGASLSVLPVVSPANGGTAGLVAQVRF